MESNGILFVNQHDHATPIKSPVYGRTMPQFSCGQITRTGTPSTQATIDLKHFSLGEGEKSWWVSQHQVVVIRHILFFSFRDKKERRKEKQKGQQNGDTSPTHNPMQPGENGIENPDFNKEV